MTMSVCSVGAATRKNAEARPSGRAFVCPTQQADTFLCRSALWVLLPVRVQLSGPVSNLGPGLWMPTQQTGTLE